MEPQEPLDSATDWHDDLDCCPSSLQCEGVGGGAAGGIAAGSLGEGGAGGAPSSFSCPAPDLAASDSFSDTDASLVAVPLAEDDCGCGRIAEAGMTALLLVLMLFALWRLGQAFQRDGDGS